MNYDPIVNGYRLYIKNYGETFRVLSFKVIVTSLYGVSTVQYFNVSMMKCRANECRCTLGCDEDVKASHNMQYREQKCSLFV